MANARRSHDFVIGHYSIDLLGELGRGQFGTLYNGTYTRNNTPIAAKKINYKTRGADNRNEELYKMATTEAEMFRKLKNHGNIVQIFKEHDDGENFWLILEYCQSGDLPTYLRKNSTNLTKKVKIMAECASAISYMHSFQPPLVHRDIKPANILMNRQGQKDVAKVTDFGLGKVYEHGQGERLQLTMNTLAGSLFYMAPEFFAADGKILQYRPGVDTFSLGLLCLYTMKHDGTSRDFRPMSVAMRQAQQDQPFGLEVANAMNRGARLPVLFNNVESGDPEERKIKDIIVSMTQCQDKDRISLALATSELTELFCGMLENNTLRQDDTHLLTQQLLEANQELTDENRNKKYEITQLNDRIQLSQNEVISLNSENEQKDDRIQALTDENRNKKSEITQLNDRIQIRGFDNKITEYLMQNLVSEARYESLEQEVSELREQINRTQAERTQVTQARASVDQTVVRRKPQKAVVKPQRETRLYTTEVSKAIEFPATWSAVREDVAYKLVVVERGTEEWWSARQGLPPSIFILSVQRLQNPHLYKQYQMHKQQMEDENPSGTSIERTLWYPVQPSELEDINTTGFTENLHKDTDCGRGVMLYTNMYSAWRLNPNDYCYTYIYRCLVMTGDYTTGHISLKSPPTHHRGRGYHSVVDNMVEPKRFVVFSERQIYPQYLLQ